MAKDDEKLPPVRPVLDNNYRGCDPYNRDFFTFRDPRNRRKAKLPTGGQARLDPGAEDEYFGIDS